MSLERSEPSHSLRGLVARRPAIDLLLLAALSLPAWLPLLAPGHPGGHDSMFHLFRLVELDRAIRSGVLYPRLAPDLALGYDYPVFNYYAPLSLYLAEALKLVGLGYVDAIKAVLALSVVGSGWTMLLFARTHLPRLGAFVAALAFAYLPYLLVDIYVRGALAEALALPLLPLCLWAFRRLVEHIDAGRIGTAALCLASLLLTHNITALFFAPVLAGYWGVVAIPALKGGGMARKGLKAPETTAPAPALPARGEGAHCPVPPLTGGLQGGHNSGAAPTPALPVDGEGAGHRTCPPVNGGTTGGASPARLVDRLTIGPVLAAAAAVGLGLALAAFYWAPALLERDLVATGQLTQQFFDYHEHFQSLGQLVQRTFAHDYTYDYARRILFHAGLVQVVVALLGVGAALLLGRARRREGLFWGLVLVGGIFLQWGRSAPLWEALPLVAFIQFPWRLLALVGLASSLLAGYLASLFLTRVRPAALGIALAGAVALALVGSTLGDFRPTNIPLAESDVRPETMQRTELDRKLIDATKGEYLPRWATVAPFDFSALPPAQPRGDVQLTLRSASLFGLDLDASADGPSTVLLDRFYFPGWQAQVDGQSVATRPDGPLGLLAVDLPAGAHRLTVSFGDTPVRAVSEGVSALGLLLLLGLIGWAWHSPRPNGPSLIDRLYGRHRWRRYGPTAAMNRRPVGASAHDHTSGIHARDCAQVISIGPSGQGRIPNLSLRLHHGPARKRAALVVALALVVLVGGWLGQTAPAYTLVPVAEGAAEEDAADFGPAVRLAGVQFDSSDPTLLRPTLYWQARTRTASDYVVSLRLVDASGKVVGLRDKRPLIGLRPTTLWEAGELVRDRQEIALQSAEIPSGEYDLVVGLRDAATGQYVRPESGAVVEWRDGSDSGVGLRLGRVQAQTCQSDDCATAQNGLAAQVGRLLGRAPATMGLGPRSKNVDVRFGGGLVGLDGYTLDRLAADGAKPVVSSDRYALTVGQGERIQVRLRWRAFRDLDRDYAAFVHLLDSKQQMLAQGDEWPHQGFFPTTLWLPGSTVYDSYTVQVPQTVPPGQYDLSLGLYERGSLQRLPLDGQANVDSYSLGKVKVVSQPLLDAKTLAPEKRLDATLGGEMTLLGYDLRLPDGGKLGASGLRPGQSFVVRLYWQAASKPPSHDYTVFVHLYGPPGPPVAQVDGPPVGGNYPTTLWEPGEVVIDDRTLTLPAELAPGQYRLAIGSYLLETGARLTLPSGEDVVSLQEVGVGQ